MQEKTTSNNIFTSTVLAAGGRAMLATPWDNFAKRSQIFQGPIGWKEIPILFFQNGPTKFDQLVNAYRGMGFGFFYKGMQTFSFDQSFELQTYLKTQLGESQLTNVISGTSAAVLQTIFLQPFSTVGTRIKVNKQAFLHPNTDPSLKPSLFMSALRQGRFFDGTTASLARNWTFLTVSSVVIDSYRQGIQRYHILGSGEKLNDPQERVARTLSGCTAVFVSVFFDNRKTLAQVNGKAKEESNIFFEVAKEIKKNGIKPARAAIPYSIAEGLGLLGFYGGIRMAKAIQEKCSQQEPVAQKAGNC